MPATSAMSKRRSSKDAARDKKSSKTVASAPQGKAGAPISKKSTKSSAADVGGYAGALRWLMAHTDFEKLRIVNYNPRTFNLDRMRRLLALMGDPQDEIKCVQVAGTKGKGSTCAMTASMLQACGYGVGLFTSPHLIDIRERIAINGQMISQSDFADLVKQVAAIEPKMADDLPTFFEILTVMGLRYFADQAVDIAVMETGLGGRLDSVTAINPLVTAITHISHDHMNILGRELTAIAREKAGIFKPGIPAISVEQDAAVARVLEEVAQQVGAPLEFTGKQIDFSYRFEASRDLGPHTRVSVTTPTSRWEHLAVPLKGEHQAHNCGLALSILDKLKAHGFVISEEKVNQGLAEAKIAGRMETVWNEPRIMIDGAHNGASVQALIRSLGAHIAYDSLVLIFGCGQDKDINGMLKQVALGADKVIFTKTRNNPRAMEPEDLLHRFNDLSGKMAQCAPTLEDALKLAGRAVSREDLIVVTGSFYLCGEARKHFLDLQNARKKK